MLIKRHIDQLRSTDVKNPHTKSGGPEQNQEHDQQTIYTPYLPTNVPLSYITSSGSSATQTTTPERIAPTTQTQEPTTPNESSETEATSIQQPIRSSKRRRETGATPNQEPIRSSKRRRDPPKYFQDYIEH